MDAGMLQTVIAANALQTVGIQKGEGELICKNQAFALDARGFVPVICM
jgi:hypothetical protein